jgi:epoxide hydrolase-like predicted phosphatase
MNTKFKKIIIWDIGGVISLAKNPKERNKKNITNSINALWGKIKFINTDDKEIYLKFKEIYFKSSRGKINKQETIKKLSNIFKLNQKETKKHLTNIIEKNVVENKRLINLILKLKKKKYKHGILSTQWNITKDIVIPKKYNKIFNKQVISNIDKITKPDVKAYKLICKKMKTTLKNVIFIDDNINNVKKANELGMIGIRYENNNQLKKELKKNKII